MREIIIRWIEEVSRLDYGDKLNLVASNKKEQQLLFEAISKEINILKKIDPQTGVQLVPFHLFKGGRFWVGIEKIMAIPTLGFVRKADGEVKKVVLRDIDEGKMRRLRLMCEDGLSLEMIEELEGPLSVAERQEVEHLKREV